MYVCVCVYARIMRRMIFQERSAVDRGLTS